MPDILIRDIDAVMAERIKQLAKERHWSINDVVLHALRHGLRMISGNVFLKISVWHFQLMISISFCN